MKRYIKWTDEEEKVILDNYGDKTTKEISRIINRTHEATKMRITKMKKEGRFRVQKQAG